MMQDGQDEEVDMTVEDMVDDTKEVTYRPQAVERQGGNQLSAYLAFVPDDVKELINNPKFTVNLVNDCNYYLKYTYLQAEGNSWTVISEGEVEPNTVLLLGELGREDVNHLDRVAVQLIAYKREKPFILKPTVDVQLRLDPVKFYKVHTMQPTDFFESPCLLYTLVENDKVARPLVVDAKKLKAEMYAGKQSDGTAQAPTAKQREQLVSRYSDDQSKGNKHNSPYIRHRGLDDAIVVDLHAEEILDTTQGMKPGEILDYQLKVFRDTMNAHLNRKGQKIVFIHDKGEGVLRRALINDLTYRYKKCTYQDASFQEYGYGATMVTINS